MKFPIEKTGFVHHMLYPGYYTDEKYHAETVIEMSRREDIGCMDCCLPIGAAHRAGAAAELRRCGKQITYVNHLFPARKISLGTADFAERAIVRHFLEREAEAAAACGASQFLFTSGIGTADDSDAVNRFAEITVWLCGILNGYGITALLEPLDTSFDKRFLLGSTEECALFVEGLRGSADNLALEVDMGHLPLLFETPEDAYRRAASVLARVHLASCVVGSPADEMFGDKHPSFFYKGGLLGRKDLLRVIRSLYEAGYMETAGQLVFEVNPLPGENPDVTVKNHIDLLASVFEELREQ